MEIFVNTNNVVYILYTLIFHYQPIIGPFVVENARVVGIVGMGMNQYLCRMNFLFLWMLKINGLWTVK